MVKAMATLLCGLFFLTSAFAAGQTKADRDQLKQAKLELAAQMDRQNANKREERRWKKAQNRAMKKSLKASRRSTRH